jgi:hypothetical protein
VAVEVALQASAALQQGDRVRRDQQPEPAVLEARCVLGPRKDQERVVPRLPAERGQCRHQRAERFAALARVVHGEHLQDIPGPGRHGDQAASVVDPDQFVASALEGEALRFDEAPGVESFRGGEKRHGEGDHAGGAGREEDADADCSISEPDGSHRFHVESPPHAQGDAIRSVRIMRGPARA